MGIYEDARKPKICSNSHAAGVAQFRRAAELEATGDGEAIAPRFQGSGDAHRCDYVVQERGVRGRGRAMVICSVEASAFGEMEIA